MGSRHPCGHGAAGVRLDMPMPAKRLSPRLSRQRDRGSGLVRQPFAGTPARDPQELPVEVRPRVETGRQHSVGDRSGSFKTERRLSKMKDGVARAFAVQMSPGCAGAPSDRAVGTGAVLAARRRRPLADAAATRAARGDQGNDRPQSPPFRAVEGIGHRIRCVVSAVPDELVIDRDPGEKHVRSSLACYRVESS